MNFREYIYYKFNLLNISNREIIKSVYNNHVEYLTDLTLLIYIYNFEIMSII